MASDQGAIVSVNGGETWSSWYNQPTAQMYHVNADNGFPYRVCGGQQESGSACVSSRGSDGMITFREWHPVGVARHVAERWFRAHQRDHLVRTVLEDAAIELPGLFYSTVALITPPLLDDADSVHAEVSREMLLRHDLVTLYANGIRYLKIPVDALA
jgi:hypothetical protein